MIPKDLWEDVVFGRRTMNEVREIIGHRERYESPSMVGRNFPFAEAFSKGLADALDPPNDCPSCNGWDGQRNEALIDEEGVVAYLHHRELRIEVADIIGYTTDVA